MVMGKFWIQTTVIVKRKKRRERRVGGFDMDWHEICNLYSSPWDLSGDALEYLDTLFLCYS